MNGLGERLRESWDVESSVSEKWEVLKAAMCDEAEAVLGYEDRRQPDWLRESETALRPLLEERNRLYALWLGTGRERDRRRHAEARRSTQKSKAGSESGKGCVVPAQSCGGGERQAWWEVGVALHQGHAEGKERPRPSENSCCEG